MMRGMEREWRGPVVASARAAIADAQRDVRLSVFADWSWDHWPADVAAELARWSDAGVDRVAVSIGSDDMVGRVDTVADEAIRA